jgi:membrane protein implicated in regulation of membrane protease activity
MFSEWHLYVIVAIMLFISETLTPGFVLASFGIGCLFSALAAGLHFDLKVQITGFIVGTLIAFFGVRPFFSRYCYKSSHNVRTNIDALVGQRGHVTERIVENSGRVTIGGDDWKAVSADDITIEEGKPVEVVRVEGTKVYVKPIQAEGKN